jgi:hypothetical protein
MKRVLIIGALGALAMVARKLVGIVRREPDFTDVDRDQPQRSVLAMEQATDVPGGVRP